MGMSVGRIRQPGLAWRSAWSFAALLYAIVLASSPLLHHDIACELKSRTHCTTCASGVSGPGLAQSSEPPAMPLPAVSALPVMGERAPTGACARALKGRSPPAA
jgi:hypothetical protein